MASRMSVGSPISPSWKNFQSRPSLPIQWSGPLESQPSSRNAMTMAAMGPQRCVHRRAADTSSILK
eukprot:4618947-Pyramimonas_sp.AAC.1